MELCVKQIDYRNPDQAADFIHLLDAYARDPMGGGKGLAGRVLKRTSAALLCL